MMHLRSLVPFLLLLTSGALRSIRIDDSRHDAQQRKNTLGDGLEVSAEARESLIPGRMRMDVNRRAGSKESPLSSVVWRAGVVPRMSSPSNGAVASRRQAVLGGTAALFAWPSLARAEEEIQKETENEEEKEKEKEREREKERQNEEEKEKEKEREREKERQSRMGKTTKSGMSYTVLARGNPANVKPIAGDLVAVRFKGIVKATGQIFDDILESPEAYYFRLGSGVTLPAVEEALLDMRTGDKWQLDVPGKLGFGEKGRQASAGKPRIPSNADLDFVLELVAVPGKDEEILEVTGGGD